MALLNDMAEAGKVLFGLGEGKPRVQLAVLPHKGGQVSVVDVIDQGFGGDFGVGDVRVNPVRCPGTPVQATVKIPPSVSVLPAAESMDGVIEQKGASSAFPGNLRFWAAETVLVNHWVSRAWDSAGAKIEVHIMPHFLQIPCASSLEQAFAVGAFPGNRAAGCHMLKGNRRLHRSIHRAGWKIKPVHGAERKLGGCNA